MSSQSEDAFNEAVERRVADIRAHLLSQDTAEAMQLAIVNTHMEDKRPEMWASAAVYTSAALAVVSSALAASSADPLADENPEGGFEGLAAGEPRCAECVVNGWKNPHPAFSSQHRAWDDGRRLREGFSRPAAAPDERLRQRLAGLDTVEVQESALDDPETFVRKADLDAALAEAPGSPDERLREAATDT